RVLLEHHLPQVFFEVTDVGASVDFCWSWHSAVPRDSPAIVNDLTPRRTRVLGPAEQDCQVGGCARAERWANVRLTEPRDQLGAPTGGSDADISRDRSWHDQLGHRDDRSRPSYDHSQCRRIAYYPVGRRLHWPWRAARRPARASPGDIEPQGHDL